MSDKTDMAPVTEIYVAWNKLRKENKALRTQLQTANNEVANLQLQLEKAVEKIISLRQSFIVQVDEALCEINRINKGD